MKIGTKIAILFAVLVIFFSLTRPGDGIDKDTARETFAWTLEQKVMSISPQMTDLTTYKAYLNALAKSKASVTIDTCKENRCEVRWAQFDLIGSQKRVRGLAVFDQTANGWKLAAFEKDGAF